MASLKRNHPSPVRLDELKQANSYQISCQEDHCDCSDFGSRCRRGFFSLWLQAIYGMKFAQRYNLTAKVDFSTPLSLYGDPQRNQGMTNFWDYYYQQGKSDGEFVINKSRESYPLRIWERAHFKAHHQIVKRLTLTSRVHQYLQNLQHKISDHRVLGLHIRLTDHSQEVEPVGLKPYLQIMHKAQHKYDKFYIATDDQRVIDRMREQWGDQRIVYQTASRSDGEQAVHTNLSLPDRYQLGLEALADCFMLSWCQHSILVHSNLSYAALMLNPKLAYTLLETGVSRRSRWRTSLVYWLDRWGIRKM